MQANSNSTTEMMGRDYGRNDCTENGGGMIFITFHSDTLHLEFREWRNYQNERQEFTPLDLDKNLLSEF